MGSFSIWHWLITLSFYLPYPILAAWLCPRAGRRRWIWVPLTLIPVFGLAAFAVLLTLAVGAVSEKTSKGGALAREGTP